MKTISTIFQLTLICFLFNILSARFSFSQKVILQLKPPIPGQLNIADLWSFTLVNTTNQPLEVYLQGIATELPTGELIVSGKTVNISLGPRETKIMKVSDFPETPEITYHAKSERYKESLERLGKFPAGTYQICIGVYSSALVNEKLTVECPEYEVSAGILTLISPEDNIKIDYRQPLVFSWSPVQQEKNYSIRIVKMTANQSPSDAIKMNRLFFELKNIRVNTFQYPFTKQKEFDSNGIYAWQIKANQNNLTSEVRSFKFSSKILEENSGKKNISSIKLKSYYELSEEPISEFHLISNDTLNLQFINNYASAVNMTFSIYDESKALVSKDSLSGLNNYFFNGLNRISLNLTKYRLSSDKIYSIIVYCFKKNLYFNFKIKNRT